MLESLKKTLSIVISLLLLTFIVANLIRLVIFSLQSAQII